MSDHSPSTATSADAEEFNTRPVPAGARLGFAKPAWVWSGFGIAFICAVIGGTIQQGLGTIDGIIAILLGNFLLFLYAAALGYGAGKWGLNFPLSVKATFGSRGGWLPILILGLLVTGWYSFHVWLTADILSLAFGIESTAVVGIIALLVGLAYSLPVIFGIKSMALIRQIAIPAMVIFVIYYVATRVIPAGGDILVAEGTGEITFLAGVGMAWATFAVSGTMTGDIVRFVKTGKQAVGVTGVAFLASNAPFMVLGALIAAAIDDPEVVYFLDSTELTTVLPLAAIAILSTWSTADACLYNASMGFSNALLGVTWRVAGAIGTVIGLFLAVTGVIGDVGLVLDAIGLLVPPVGAVIIAEYFIMRRGVGYGMNRRSTVNTAAIVGVLVGLAVGIIADIAFPNWIFGLPAMAASIIVYLLLAKTLGQKVGAEPPSLPAEAETVDKHPVVRAGEQISADR
ncbi:cytosine permease [Nesterenkonia populi]